MRPSGYASPHATAGGMNSPMLGQYHVRGSSTISPPPVPVAAGLAPAEWPAPQGYAAGYRKGSEDPLDQGYDAMVAELQARVRDADARERAALAQLNKERVKHQAIVTAFLAALRAICKKTDIPEDIPSPGRASILSVQVKSELMQNDMDKELAMASAQAASSKIQELVDAMKEKDMTVLSLEERICVLADQVKILQTSPVRTDGQSRGGGEEEEDPSLISATKSIDGLTADGKTTYPYPVAHGSTASSGSVRRYLQTPSQQQTTQAGSVGTSPARSAIRSPNRATPASNPRSAAKEWPPSPRRVHAEDEKSARVPVARASPKPSSARKEWPPSPRRSDRDAPAPAPAASPARKEWPPSPRRTNRQASPQRDWADLTATPDTAPHFEQVVITSASSSEHGSLQRTQQGNASANGLGAPTPGFEEGVSPRRERCLPAEPQPAVQEWPPSPQRQRSPAPVQEEAAAAPQAEWPPSPARNRGGAPTQEAGGQESSYMDLLAEEEAQENSRQDTNDDDLMAGSPQNAASPLAQTMPVQMQAPGAGAGEIQEFPPSPQRQRPMAANEPEGWHPSPTRARVQQAEEQSYHSRTPQRLGGASPAVSARSSAKAKSWPKSPRREAVEEVPRTPEQALAAVPAPGATPNYNIGPKTLEWPATGSPPNPSRDTSTAGTDPAAPETTLERKRSVGFICVPEEAAGVQATATRRGSNTSDVGAARRAVDLIRDVHVADTTPTARMKILALERELERLRGTTADTGVLDDTLRRAAEKIFREISSLCQGDGRISKAKLGHILKEERLGARILFHELDSNENGEVSLDEWLNWFGHLQRREAAANMLDWLEERFQKASTESKNVGFDAPETVVCLAPEVEAQALAVFAHMEALFPNAPVQKARLQGLLRDGVGCLDPLNTAEGDEVHVNNWIMFLEGVLRGGGEPAEVLAWAERQLAAAVAPPPQANGVNGNHAHHGAPVTPVRGAGDLNAGDRVDTDPAAADEDSDAEEGGPALALGETLTLRVTSAFHAVDEFAGNTTTIPKAALEQIIGLTPMTADVFFSELYVIAEGEPITMENWMEWFLRLSEIEGRAEDMASYVEARIAERRNGAA